MLTEGLLSAWLILRNVYLLQMILELTTQFGLVALGTIHRSLRVKKDFWKRASCTLSQYWYFAVAIINEFHNMQFCLCRTLLVSQERSEGTKGGEAVLCSRSCRKSKYFLYS